MGAVVGEEAGEKEIAVAVLVGCGGAGGIEVHDLVVSRFVGWPCGLRWGAGVAGAGEGGPVVLHLGAEGAVFRANGHAGAGVQGAEDVLDIV